MERLEGIKNGMRSSIQEEWPSWEDIDWLIKQAEQLEKLQEQTLYSDFINRINELEKEIKQLKESRKENHSGSQHETHTILDRGAE